jgi:DNA-binding IclR family transcriptional regulator
VRLGVLRGSDVLTLQPYPNRVNTGVHAEALLHGVLSAHAAASGKALLAFSPPGVVNRVIAAGLPAFTWHTITSPDMLRQRLSVIITQIATSRNELSAAKRRSRCRSSTARAASRPPSNSPEEIWAAN